MSIKLFVVFLLVFGLNAASVSAQEKVPATSGTNIIMGGVVNGKAQSLPKPAYPAAALAVRAQGAVNVQVTIDESGSVISATAVSGHPLLRAAAVEAAKQAKFSPTILSGQPAKVTGVIVYNFVAPAAPTVTPPVASEKMRFFGLGMVFYSLKELDSERGLENLAVEAARFNDPNLANILKPIEQLPSSSAERKKEIVNDVYAELERSLSGSDLWQWEMGKNFGGIMTQMRLRRKDAFNQKVDGEILRNHLLKIRDLSYTVPSDIPTGVAEKLRTFGDFIDKEDLSNEEKLAAIGVRTMDLIKIIMTQ